MILNSQPRCGAFTETVPEEDLLELLTNDPCKYFRCKLFIKWWNQGKAVVLDGKHARKQIELPTRESLGRTFDGDIVVVQLQGVFHDDEPSFGKVEGILKRCEDIGHRVFVCKVDKNSTKLMRPVDSKSTKIKVVTHGLNDQVNDDDQNPCISVLKFCDGCSGRLELTKKVKPDDETIFCVQVLKWDENNTFPLGYVKSTYLHQEDILKNIYRVPGPFQRIHKIASDLLGRKQTVSGQCQDCTHLFSFTIDAANTKVFDDAFSIEKCEEHSDCCKIWIHVTNVASVVPQNDEIDNVAKNREVSFGDVVKGNRGHMFPPGVRSKCSLNKENAENLAVSVTFHSLLLPTEKNFSDKGCFPKVMLTKIKVSENLTFGEAEEYLQTKQSSNFSESATVNLYQKLNHLWKVFWSLRTERLGPAALYHQMSLSSFSETSNELLARILVEEAMITTNSIFAKFLCDKSVQFIGRLQASPNPCAESSSASEWYASNLSIYQKSCYDREEISASRKILVTENERPICMLGEVKDVMIAAIRNFHSKTALLLACCDDLHPSFRHGVMNYRSIQERSEDFYHTSENDCKAHFSLGLPCYLKSTSPLRRYVDLANQRQIIAAIEKRAPALPSDLHSQGGERRFVKDFVKREEQVTDYKNAVDGFKFCSSLPTEKCHSFSAIVIELHYGMLKFAWMNANENLSFSFKPQFLQATNRCSSNGGKVVYEWNLRYYDVEDIFGFHDLPDDTEMLWMVSSEEWQNFQQRLRQDIELQNVPELGEKLKNILETARPKKRYLKQEKELFDQTSNGIHHGRKFELDMTPGSLIHFMALPSLKSFPPQFIPEMLSLDDDVDVCLVHRRDISVFPSVDTGTALQHSHSAYVGKLMELVVKEGRYCAVTDGNAIIFQNIKMTFEYCTGFFKLSVEYCKTRFIKFNVGDLLCLHSCVKEKSNKVGWMIHAVITKVDNNKGKSKEIITVKFEYQKNSVYTATVRGLKDVQLTCEFFPISIVYRRMLKALSMVDQNTTPEIVQRLCCGHLSIGNTQHQLTGTKKNLHDKLLDGLQLNNCQRGQICKALQQRITLIQGPPGTGKSVLGAHLAYYFWKVINNKEIDKKVLYCGPSNKSVDVVAGYLVKANLNGMRVVRVYATALEECDYPVAIKPSLTKADDLNSPDKKLKSISLHEVIRRKGRYSDKIKEFDREMITTLAEYDKYKKLLEKAKMQELDKCNVILCTCSTAGSEIISDLEFSQCIVDECGMCSEPETLVPVTASMSETLQIVLIGDHKQLSPIVKCKEAQALTRSMFERLSRHANMLDTQYRMHEKICAFHSEEFYDEKLITAEEVRSRRNEFFFGQTPMQFFHIVGKELEEDDSYSKYNMEEVEVVNKIVVRLVARHHIAPKRIMVLSPYLGQCNHLQEKLKKSLGGRSDFHDLHIGSVVTSQGSEADYVIVSTARSCRVYGNHESDWLWMYKRLGFVTDEHQVNVAITRAKLGLYIVVNVAITRAKWRLYFRQQKAPASASGLASIAGTLPAEQGSSRWFLDENEDDESVLGSDYDDYDTDGDEQYDYDNE